MAEIEKIVDYNVNLDLLIQQFKDKPKFLALCTDINNQANNIETALFEIRDNFWIDTAVGIQLDVLGDIQKQSRQGITDDSVYRSMIKSKIVVNNGSGERSTFITLLTQLYGAEKCQIQNWKNLQMWIWTDIDVSEDLFNLLVKTAMSGVGVVVVFGSILPFVTSDLLEEDEDGLGLTEALLDDFETFSDGSSVTFSDLSVVDFSDSTGSDQTDGGELQEVRQII